MVSQVRQERCLGACTCFVLLLVDAKEEVRLRACELERIVRVDAPRRNAAKFAERAEIVMREEGARVLERYMRKDSHDSRSSLCVTGLVVVALKRRMKRRKERAHRT